MDDEPPTEAYDPVAAVEIIYEWLDRWGSKALHSLAIQPDDPVALERARDRATDAAIVNGRGDLLSELQAGITDWALKQYRRQGFGAIYFQPAMEPPEQRLEAIEVLIDAATANLVADLVPEAIVDTLVARFALVFGGSDFTVEPQEPAERGS
jgi:hypothetical protein